MLWTGKDVEPVGVLSCGARNTMIEIRGGILFIELEVEPFREASEIAVACPLNLEEIRAANE